MLPAGEMSATRPVVFSNPGVESIDFEPRWLLPANQARHSTHGPVKPGNGPAVPGAMPPVGRGRPMETA